MKFFKKIIFFTNIIFVLITLILFILYLKKLNNLIDNKINNNTYKPILIYSKIFKIKNNSNIDRDKIIKILLLSGYEKKNLVVNPGEFTVIKDYLILFRRSFNFPKKYEDKILIKFKFLNNKLSNIYDMENKEINSIKLEPNLITVLNNINNKQKIFIPIKSFPKTLINMLIEIEDKKYFSHVGINLLSILRAFIINIYKMKIIQGGSTLTQQLSKNLFLNNKKKIIRKINEIIISLLIEYKYNKNKILELYLNEVYFGNFYGKEVRGFPLASIYYFNKKINDLSLDEQALLIGIIKGSSLYNPWKNKDLVIKRRNFILKKIYNKNIINYELYNNLSSKKLNFKFNIENKINFPSFVQIINKHLKNSINELNNNETIRVFSTLDLISQINAQNSIKYSFNILKKRLNDPKLEIAMIVLDYRTGEIKSTIGGSNYQYLGFNRILSRRQIGSLIKPLIYLYVLNDHNNYRLNTILPDNKIDFDFNGKIWSPKNSDNKYRKNVKLIDALVYSLNIPTVHLGMNIGISNFIKYLKEIGIKNKLLKNLFPSIFLGAIDLSLIEVSQIYQLIANNGNYSKLHSIKYILNSNNEIIFKRNKNIKKIISDQSSYLVLYCMKRITEYGTAKNLSTLNIKLAGKTGTTNNFKDSWFIGIDGDEICAIWIGKDDNTSTYLSGSKGAMFVYKKYLEINKSKDLNLNVPKDIYEISIDEFGKFVCDKHNYKDKLPVWINNPKIITKKCPYHSFLGKIINNLLN